MKKKSSKQLDKDIADALRSPYSAPKIALFIVGVASIACRSAPIASKAQIVEVSGACTITTIYSFARGDGGHPRAQLVEACDGRLYGSTWTNGANDGGSEQSCSNGTYTKTAVFLDQCPGTIYGINRDGSRFHVLHAFSRLDALGRNDDGYQSVTPLVQGPDGFLHGVSRGGGVPQPPASATTRGCGTSFKVRPSGDDFSRVYSFCSSSRFADGASPNGGPVVDGDEFVGAAGGGNNGTGVLYAQKLDGTTSNLFTFATVDRAFVPPRNATGSTPYGSPTKGPDGRWYGMAIYGGANGRGGIYRFDRLTSKFEWLHSFESYTFIYNTDNTPLQSPIAAGNGALYIANEFGGPSGTGIVARVTPATGTVDIIHTFGAIGHDTIPRFSNGGGALPIGNLAELGLWLYGTTYYGGAAGVGGLYRISRDGSTFEWLHSFSAGAFASGGNYAHSGMIRASDGKLYGTTFAGGASGFGTIYRMSCP